MYIFIYYRSSVLHNQEKLLEQQTQSLENEKEMIDNELFIINNLEHTKNIINDFHVLLFYYIE